MLSDTVSAAFIESVGSDTTYLEGAEIVNVQYRTRTGNSPSCGLRTYEFDRFEESSDSLVVRGLVREHGPLFDSLAFAKGDIRADLDAEGLVEKLTVNAMNVGLLPGYRTSQPFEKVIRPTACVITYWLTPTRSPTQTISDFGVFKLYRRCRGDC